MRTRRLLGAAALATFVAVGLTGCIKMDMQLDLKSDDTVDGSMVFAISTEFAELMGEDAESIADSMQQDMIDVGDGGETRSEPYDDGEYIGTTTFFEGQSLETFSSGEDTESLQILREGDEFVVSGVMDLSEGAEDSESMMPGIGDSMDIKIAITFPGSVSDHNGELSGNTVTWVPVFGERLEIQARGSAVEGGGGGIGGLSLPLLIGIGLAVLLLVGLVLFFVLRSRKGGQPAAAGATAYPAPAGYAPAAPTAYAPAPAVDQVGYAPQAPPVQAPPAPPVQQAPPAPPAPPTES